MARRAGAAAAIAVLALLAGEAAAAQPNDYDLCLALVASEPERAESEAAHWAKFGGGAPARHCRALALAALGADAQAAALLAEIGAGARELPDEARAEILRQSAALFLSAGDAASGLGAVGEALRLSNDAAGLELRARLHAEARDWPSAMADLDRLLRTAPPTAERLALRASARRQAGMWSDARADAIWALELSPGHPDALLELGAVEALLGHRDAARRALMGAIEADPEGPVAGFARRRLQELEAGGGAGRRRGVPGGRVAPAPPERARWPRPRPRSPPPRVPRVGAMRGRGSRTTAAGRSGRRQGRGGAGFTGKWERGSDARRPGAQALPAGVAAERATGRAGARRRLPGA